jgi:alkylated DNA repair dioxygenase AlkB
MGDLSVAMRVVSSSLCDDATGIFGGKIRKSSTRRLELPIGEFVQFGGRSSKLCDVVEVIRFVTSNMLKQMVG